VVFFRKSGSIKKEKYLNHFGLERALCGLLGLNNSVAAHPYVEWWWHYSWDILITNCGSICFFMVAIFVSAGLYVSAACYGEGRSLFLIALNWRCHVWSLLKRSSRHATNGYVYYVGHAI